MTKDQLLAKTKERTPFVFDEFKFEDLEDLLKRDALYSNFQFADGIRGKDNIIGGTSWLILDIDTSTITDEEAQLLLEGINHYIVRTSDKTNAFKFRVILELSTVVNLDGITWKYFIKKVGEYLGLIIDPVAQSQVFYSYKGRNILMELEGEALDVKNLVVQAINEKEKKLPDKPISTTQKKSMLDNPMTTFEFAFNSSSGNRSTNIMRMCYYARDLGSTKKYIRELVWKVNNYLDLPLEEEYINRCIISQVNRWNF